MGRPARSGVAANDTFQVSVADGLFYQSYTANFSGWANRTGSGIVNQGTIAPLSNLDAKLRVAMRTEINARTSAIRAYKLSGGTPRPYTPWM